jgi:hypothetical protein
LNATGLTLNSQTPGAFYAAPIRQSTAANTLYYDTSNNEIIYEGAATIETINFSNFGQTSKLNSVPYRSNQQITTSNVVANLDNWADNDQTYTFGPKVQARYIAGGAGSTTSALLAYSSDGINWIPSTSGSAVFAGGSITGGNINKIAYNGSIWVAVAGTVLATTMNTIGYSFDGINWTAASGTTLGTTTSFSAGYGVAWGKDKFVAVGTNTSTSTQTIVYSYDGINWLSAAGTTFNGVGGEGRAVAYNGTRWVAVGRNATTTPTVTAVYSSDGITWTATTTNMYNITASFLSGLTTSGTTSLTITGAGVTGTLVLGQVLTSTAVSAGTLLQTFVSGTFAANSSTYTLSVNAIGSGTSSFTAGTNGIGYDVAWNGSRWVSVGTCNTSTSFASANTINYSTDGITWTAVTPAPTTNIGTSFNGAGGEGRCVAWNGIKFVAGGRNNSTPTQTLLYSGDGINWSSVSPEVTYALGGTAGVSSVTLSIIVSVSGLIRVGQFISGTGVTAGAFISALGTGTGGTGTYTMSVASTIAASAILTFSSQNPYPSQPTPFSGSARCLNWNGTKWLAGGTGTNTLVTSLDGISWTPVNTGTYLASTINGIAYNSVRPNTITFPRNILVGVGSYSPAIIATSTASSIAVTTGVLTVGGTVTGVWQVGLILTGTGVPLNTVITSAISGTGGAGTYQTNITTAVASTAISGTQTAATSTTSSITATTGVLTVGGTLTGVWQVGLTLTGTGVPANTVITALLSGTGGAGTYQTNTITAVASTSIAGLQASTTAYSTDGGLTWTPGTGVFNFPSTPSSINSWGLCVAYNGYMWVAGGGNNQLGFNTTVALAYSYDGINWTAVPNSSSTTAPSFILGVKSICWSPVRKIWIAVGFDTKVAYSYDGITWTFVTGPSIFYLFSVSWGKDKFIASGGLDSLLTNDIAYSFTGLSGSWVLSPNPLTGTGGIFSTLYNGTMWVGVGSATNGTNGAIYSYDGITWVVGSGATFSSYEGGSTTGGQAGTAWNGSRWIITTGSTSCTNPVFYSDNGINWTQSTTTAVVTGSIATTVLTVTAITSGTVLIGQVLNTASGGVITSFGTGRGGTGTYNISVSQTVASTTITGTLTAGGTCAVWNSGRFIVGLRNASTLSYMTSPDGIVWTSNAAKQFTAPYGIAGAVNQQNPQALNVNVAIQQPTLAFGSGTNTIAYSYDGIVWRGLGTTIFTTTGYCGCWNGKLWVAGGVSSGVGILAYSYNGIDWTIATQSILSTIVWSIAWNGTVFVAVGQGASTIAYSYDGINWQTPTTLPTGFTIGYSVAWGQNYFVVVGQGVTNNYAYSTNGISWTGGVILSTSATFRSIICGQSLWVTVGTTGTIAQGYWATNPTSTWTSGTGFPTAGSSNQLFSVTYGVYPVSSAAGGTTYGTIFCAGGATFTTNTSACIYSTDGKAWTTSASGNTAFNNVQLNSLVWNGKRFIGIAGTSATNTRIAYSYNGQTWFTAGITPTTQGSLLFTTAGYGLATAAWPTLGSVYVDNALTLSSTSGLNTNNQLDIYSDTYFNNGYNNMALTIKATQIP